MTRAPWHGEAGQRVASPRAILSRLLVLLALVLFGVPQSHVDGMPAHAGPVAQNQAEQAQGILTVQRYLLRAQLPQGDPPEFVVPGAADQTRQPLFAAMMSPAPRPSLPPLAIRILPPVRGPPAV